MQTTLLKVLEHPNFIQGEHWEIKTYVAGKTVLEEGDNNACIFLILNGTARVVANIVLDKNKTIHPGFSDVKKYDIFGELSFIDQQPHSTSVIAITECEIAEIDNKALNAFLKNQPEIGLSFYTELSKTLTQRLRKTSSKAFSLFAWGLKNQGIDQHLK
ncbi:MAG: hypothetical protein COB26_05145 [Piscirickettsiaceae bacterium]|nr:MAG: hypothetical protein COB89_04260 [Piscirickettsiaceae bacterium]PCI69935.1 MAG: hypothetical protein COB26_05145 [Piscirickettsiaceae bacterium]